MIPNKPPKEFKAKDVVTPGGLARAYAAGLGNRAAMWLKVIAVLTVLAIFAKWVVQPILEIWLGPLDGAKVGSATVLVLFAGAYFWMMRK